MMLAGLRRTHYALAGEAEGWDQDVRGEGGGEGEGTCDAGGAEEDALRPHWGGGGLGPGGERGGGSGGRRNV